MSKIRKNIGVFIDGDNLAGYEYTELHKKLKEQGRIIFQNVYGDFSKHEFNTKWEKVCQDHGLNEIHVRNRKESTDMKMIVDIMTILHKEKEIDIFAIVSNDADFFILIDPIKLENKKCFISGYKDIVLTKMTINCDKFIPLDRTKKKRPYIRKKKEKKNKEKEKQDSEVLEEKEKQVSEEQNMEKDEADSGEGSSSGLTRKQRDKRDK